MPRTKKQSSSRVSKRSTPARQDSVRATTEPRVQPTRKRKSAATEPRPKRTRHSATQDVQRLEDATEPRPKRTRRSATQDVQRLEDAGGEHAPLTQADIPGIVQAVLANLPGRSTPPPDDPDYAPQHDLSKKMNILHNCICIRYLRINIYVRIYIKKKSTCRYVIICATSVQLSTSTASECNLFTSQNSLYTSTASCPQNTPTNCLSQVIHLPPTVQDHSSRLHYKMHVQV